MEPHLRSRDGHLTDEGTALYVDALKLGKTSRLPEWMIDHVSECHPCKERITGLFALVPAQEYTGIERHPFFDRLAPSGTWYRVAAAVALLAAAGITAYLLMTEKPRPPYRSERGAESVADSSAPPVQPALAGVFATDPAMEALVDLRQRSSEVRVTSPLPGTEIRGDVTFRWEGTGPAAVEVYSNRRELVKALQVSISPVQLREGLQPGLYYWKLVEKDELVYVGKFLVK